MWPLFPSNPDEVDSLFVEIQTLSPIGSHPRKAQPGLFPGSEAPEEDGGLRGIGLAILHRSV